MRLLGGRRAIESVVALSQSTSGLTLGELSQAIGGPLSSAQRGIESLVNDDLVIDRRVGSRRHYAINREHPAGDALVEFSMRVLPPERASDLILRANPAVQFAGRDHSGYLVVLSPFAEMSDLVLLSAALHAINGSSAPPIPIEMIERHDVKERLFDSSELRERGLRLVPVKGSAIRVFRDPYEHGSMDASRLGRLHPSLRMPSRRVMKRIAEKHGLGRIAAFGSSVRSDFRPDSDVDILIEPKAETRLGIGDLLDIRRELEGLFDRDVDVVNVRTIRAEPLRRARQEGVVLYG